MWPAALAFVVAAAVSTRGYDSPIMPQPVQDDMSLSLTVKPAPSCTVSSITQKPPHLESVPRRPFAAHQFPTSPTCRWSGQQRGIAHIHVGKAGGSSVHQVLRQSNVTFHSVHTRNAADSIDCRFSLYVVSTRDPLNRTLSAFNWRHPIGGDSENGANKGPENEMYSCFPELPGGVNRFAEALDEDSRCGLLARTCLHQPSAQCMHLGRGHYYYLVASALMDVLMGEGKHVAIVRQESLESDVDALLEWLCVAAEARAPLDDLKTTYRRSSDTRLSAKGRAALERHLGGEHYAKERIEGLDSLKTAPPAYSTRVRVSSCASQCA
jgi:hypothetical protein